MVRMIRFMIRLMTRFIACGKSYDKIDYNWYDY